MWWKYLAAMAVCIAALQTLHVRSLKAELKRARSQLTLCVEGVHFTQEPLAITKTQAKNDANGLYDNSEQTT